MHELSIATSIVEIAREHALSDHPHARVRAIRLEIGELSCVQPESLRFGFEIASAETCVAGARLEIQSVPVVVFCPQCQVERVLPSIQKFRCPECETPTPEVRRGKELDIVAIELEPQEVAT